MKRSLFHLPLLFFLSVSDSRGKILRNNALMNKMVSDFHAPRNGVVDVMRNVLCRNFPSIPCKVITKDNALRKLILKTVSLLNDKQRTFNQQNTSITPTEQNRVPVINSEELSHYLAVENTGYFTEKEKQLKGRQLNTPKAVWAAVDKERTDRRPVMAGHKNIRKYFPHKIKHIDANDLQHFKEQEASSEEGPDMDLKTHEHFSHKQSSHLPVWQIDYTKHGDPRLPSYSQETDMLKGKLMNGAQDSVVKHRKNVLHPDLYIKNSAKRNVDINYKK